MQILFQISDFINLPSIIAFGLGVLFGFLLLLLVYVYAAIKGINKKMRKRKPDEEDVDINEIEWLINEAKSSFKEQDKLKERGTFEILFDISKALATDVASKFYPRSKYPLRELTIDETLVLTHYISDRVDELLSAKILARFRGMTIQQILMLKDVGEKVTESKIYTTAAGAQLGKVWGALRAVNPIYWIKKGTVDQAIKIILRKISLNVIVITGEETYKIYSKKLFEVKPDDELSIEDLYDIIEAEGGTSDV